jgi:hypothetical protein
MDTTNLLLITASLTAIAFTVYSISNATVTVTDPKRFDSNAQSVNSVLDAAGNNLVWSFGSYSLGFLIMPVLIGTAIVKNKMDKTTEEFEWRDLDNARDVDADLASFKEMMRNERLDLDGEVLENIGVFENQF